LRIAWPATWSARDYWSEMPSTAILRSTMQMKIRWISCEGTPILTASLWGFSEAAKSLPYKRCPKNAIAITWAQRLKQVFNIDVQTCRVCGGNAKVIA